MMNKYKMLNNFFISSLILFIIYIFIIIITLLICRSLDCIIYINSQSKKLISVISTIANLYTGVLTFVIFSLTIIKKNILGINGQKILLFARNKKHNTNNIMQKIINVFKKTRIVDDINNMITSLLISLIISIYFSTIIGSFAFILLFYSIWCFYRILWACFYYVSEANIFKKASHDFLDQELEQVINESYYINKNSINKLDITDIKGYYNYIINKKYNNYDEFEEDFSILLNQLPKIIQKEKYNSLITYLLVYLNFNIIKNKYRIYKKNKNFINNIIKFKTYLTTINNINNKYNKYIKYINSLKIKKKI